MGYTFPHMNMPSTQGSPDSSVDTLTPTGRGAEHGRHGRPDDAATDSLPSSVTYAFYALVTALVLAVVNGLVSMISPPTTKEYADFIQGMHFPTDPAGTRAAAEAGNTAATVNLVLIVVFVAIFAYLGMLMRQGSAWSRIVIAVFAVIGVLGGLAAGVTNALVAPLPIAGGEVGVVLLALLPVALAAYLVFAFWTPSNRFFATSGW